MPHIQVGGVLACAAGAYGHLVDFIMSHMNILFRAYDINNLIDDIADDHVTLFMGRAVGMGVKSTGRLVGCSCILTFFPVLTFRDLRNLRMCIGDVLDMTERLYFRDYCKTEGFGIIDQFTHLFLLQQLAAGNHFTVREWRYFTFFGGLIGLLPGITDLRVTLKTHATGKFNKQGVVTQRQQNITQQAPEKAKGFAGRQADVKTAQGFIGLVKNPAQGYGSVPGHLNKGLTGIEQ